MGSERIAVGIGDGIAHVELARPDKYNAMDKQNTGSPVPGADYSINGVPM